MQIRILKDSSTCICIIKSTVLYSLGRDGTRAFVTGEFNEEGLIDDVEGLTALQLGELEEWMKFYDKDYTFVGKLIGRYNTKEGSPTKEWYKFMKGLGEKEKFKAEQRELEKHFPGCNSRWNEQEGGVVFCSEKRYMKYACVHYIYTCMNV